MISMESWRSMREAASMRAKDEFFRLSWNRGGVADATEIPERSGLNTSCSPSESEAVIRGTFGAGGDDDEDEDDVDESDAFGDDDVVVEDALVVEEVEDEDEEKDAAVVVGVCSLGLSGMGGGLSGMGGGFIVRGWWVWVWVGGGGCGWGWRER